MNKQGTGLLLLAAAAGLGWLWWQRRNSPAALAAGETDAAAAGLGSLKQIGSTFQEDSSPDVIKAALDFTAKLVKESGPCWKGLPDPANPGYTAWYRTQQELAAGDFARLPIGQTPATGTIC